MSASLGQRLVIAQSNPALTMRPTVSCRELSLALPGRRALQASPDIPGSETIYR
jgi:hypothetical protein